MNFTLADLDLYWVGTDDDTPAGCTIANGVDPVGNTRVFLWRGSEPDDGAFLGSVLITDRHLTAYGPRGGYAKGTGTMSELLACLANA